MVEYASGSIKFSGLGGDTDFQAMIDKLAKIETRQVNQLLKWKADWQKRLDAFRQVRTEMLNLQTSLNSMNSMNKFLVKEATSSDQDVATGLAGADAMNGTYSLDIKQLASQYSWSKNTGLYNKTDVACPTTNGTLQYSYKGIERTLFIPKGTTLDGLKNIINNDSRNPGVKAQLIVSQDGIVFQLHGKDTGSANTVLLQKTDGIDALGTLTLTNQRYIETENSMELTNLYADGDALINTSGQNKTFVFSVDGKRASIAVPPTMKLSELVTAINDWGTANLSSQNGEQIASLESVPGGVHLKIAKMDSVYGAGTYNDALQDVVTSSYASGATLPSDTYTLALKPPAYASGMTAADYTVSVSLGAGQTLTDLRDAFRAAIAGHSPELYASVNVMADPDDPTKERLVFGPAGNTEMKDILEKDWNDVDTEEVDYTAAVKTLQFKFTNSDVGEQANDIVTINLPKDKFTARELCDAINQGMAGKGTAKLVVSDTDPSKWKIAIESNTITHRVRVEDGTLDTMNYALPQEASGTWVINQGQNAQLRVNGWPNPPQYMESATNNIAAGTMIDGMSLTLRSAGLAVISVTNDTAKMTENVENFVKAINSFRTVLQSLTEVDSEKSTLDPDYAESQFEMQKGSVLTGNYGIQLISSRLANAVASAATGFSHQMKDPITGFVSGDFFAALSEIGITTNASQGGSTFGLLEINEIDGYKGLNSLGEALTNNPEAVARLFAAREEGVSNNPEWFQYNSHIAGIAKPGTYSVNYTIALDGSNNPYIDTATINGKPAKIDNANRQITLISGDNDPAKSIMIDIFDMTPGVQHNGSVSIKEGKVNELLRMMDGSEGMLGSKGPLKHLEENYQLIMDNIEKKIKSEDDRLVKWRRTMDMKFARLDAVLAKYNNISTGLKSQIAQLGQKG